MITAFYASFQGKLQYIIVYYQDGDKVTYACDDPESLKLLWDDITAVFPEHECYINNGSYTEDSDWFTILLISTVFD